MNCRIGYPAPRCSTSFLGSGFLQLDVLPGIGIAAGGIARKHILPFRRRYARPDRIDKSVAEDRDEIIILDDLTLNVFCQSLALVAVDRGEVLIEFVVELPHTVAVLAIEAAAAHEGIVPVGPGAAHARRVHDDLHTRPLLEAALQPLQKDAALHRLHL